MKNAARAGLTATALLATLGLAACGSSELEVKRDRQAAEIARLDGELALIQEKLKDAPPDPGVPLEEARKEADKQSKEIDRFETEIAELEATKASLDKEFAEFREKYPLQ